MLPVRKGKLAKDRAMPLLSHALPALLALLLADLIGGSGGLRKPLGAAVRGRARGGDCGGHLAERLLPLPVLLFADPEPNGGIGWGGFAMPVLLERADALPASVALGLG